MTCKCGSPVIAKGKCPACYKRAWREANREWKRIYDREWAAKNAEKRRAYMATYYVNVKRPRLQKAKHAAVNDLLRAWR